MSDSFVQFTEAVSASSSRTKGPLPAKALGRVAVLGGGADARLLAALCLSEGADVTLFSAYGAELESLRASSGITLRGEGPIGTFAVDRDSGPSVKTTAELDSAVRGADVIFLTGPVHKQRTYAMVLADHLADGQVLVIAPGRSLGAVEAAWMLRIGGCSADITLVEAQGLPFWISETGAVLNLTSAGPVTAATLPRGRTDILEALSVYLPNLEPVSSVLESGFADGSALVELPALLLSGPALSAGAAEVPMGGVPLAENQTFGALIGDQHRAVISAMAAERRAVAHAFGVRKLPGDDAWITSHAGATRGAGSRNVPDRASANALLRDGVIGSLVPLISAADLAGVDVPMTRSMVTLAGTVLGADVAAAGRRLETIGITANDLDDARKALDAQAVGS
jgi:opine dehydrogenase